MKSADDIDQKDVKYYKENYPTLWNRIKVSAGLNKFATASVLEIVTNTCKECWRTDTSETACHCCDDE